MRRDLHHVCNSPCSLTDSSSGLELRLYPVTHLVARPTVSIYSRVNRRYPYRKISEAALLNVVLQSKYLEEAFFKGPWDFFILNFKDRLNSDVNIDIE